MMAESFTNYGTESGIALQRQRNHSTLGLFLVMGRLPETDPYVEQSQSAAHAANKTIGDKGSQCWKHNQKSVIDPLGCPGKNNQQHTGNRTHQYKKKNRRAVQPLLQPPATWVFKCGRRWSWYPIAVIWGRAIH